MAQRKRTKKPGRGANRKMSILYEEAPNRPVLPVGGAIGAPSPDGSSVVAHLYNEFVTIPTLAKHDISSVGEVDLSKGVAERRGDITRLITASIVLSPETAIRLANFLLRQASRAKDQRQQNQPKPARA